MKKLYVFKALLIFSLFFHSITLFAQLDVDNTSGAGDFIQTLVGQGVDVFNVQVNCPEISFGTFESNGSNVGIDQGVIMTSGDATLAQGPNTAGGTGAPNGSYTVDADLEALIPGFSINDACVIEFDFIPQGDSLSFNYVFGSEEYSEYVNSTFNDVFGFFVSGPGISGYYTNDAVNIALIPGTNIPVAIDNVNNGEAQTGEPTGPCMNCDYFIYNGDGNCYSTPTPVECTDSTFIQYDGLTTVLTAGIAVNPCDTFHIKLAIADAGDTAFDSGVFIQGSSFSTNIITLSSQGVALDDTFDTAVEGCVDGQFTFTASAADAYGQTVDFEIGGTAVAGVDYVAFPPTIDIAPNETTFELVIETIDDGVDNGPQTIQIIVENPNCMGVMFDTATLVIAEPPNFTVTEEQTICLGDTAQLVADGAITYEWLHPDIDYVNEPSQLVSPEVSTTYEVVLDYGTCTETLAAEVIIDPCLACPTNVVATASANEACSNDIIDLNFTTDAPDSLITVFWAGPGDVFDNQVWLSNDECAPADFEFVVTVICNDDQTVMLTDTVNITVYPNDLSPFIIENESDCEVSLDVAQGCEDYISVSDALLILPGDSGSTDIFVSYLPSNLCVDPYAVTLEYDCPFCNIQVSEATVQACDGEQFYINLDLVAEDNSDSFTVVDANGNSYGTYNYADLPVLVGPFAGDEVTEYEISISDSVNDECTATATFGPVDCLVCSINSVSIEASECELDMFTVQLDAVYQNTSGNFIVNDYAGNSLGTFAYSELPITLGPFVGDNYIVYSFEVVDEVETDCSFTAELGRVDCVCNIDDYSITALDCDGQNFSIEVVASGINTSDSYNVFVNGANVGTFNYADGAAIVGAFPGDNSSTYLVEIQDSAFEDCGAVTEIGPIACAVCDSGNLVAYGNCNGTDIATFDVYTSFTGNNIYTISDDAGNVYATGIPAGDDVFIGAFPNNAVVNLIISDDLVENCILTATVDCILCDPAQCNSQEGTIMASATELCPEDNVIVDADDFLLMPKQSVFYLFHNQAEVTVSDLPDLINDVYTTGSFLANNNDVIPCGTVVYATAIGAMEDHDMPGFPNYNDICLTVSNTIPIYFACPIVIDVVEICDNSTGEFSFNFDVSGGFPEFFPSTGYEISGDYTGSTLSGDVLTVGPLTDSDTYTITAVDDNGCSGTITNPFVCIKLPIELISFEGEAQANGNALKWLTATEIDNDYFTLEKSIDGVSFEAIHTEKGAGTTSTPQAYEYLDEQVSSGISYYRLSQTDFDGSTSIAGIISIERTQLENIVLNNLHPMPINNLLNIEISAQSNEQINIQIYNMAAQILISELQQIQEGINTFGINTTDLAEGIYLLEIESSGQLIQEKIIKQ